MIRYSDIYVSTLARGLLNADEQLIGSAACEQRPWWAFRIPFFAHHFLILTTNQRIILVDHRRGLLYDRLDRIESVSLGQVDELKSAGVFGSKFFLRIGNRKLKFKVPSGLAPLPRNRERTKAIATTWKDSRAMGPAKAPAVLGSREAQPSRALAQ